MTTWAPRLAKIQLLHSSRGTGWAVGRSGVLTATSVVAGLLPGADDTDAGTSSVEVVLSTAPERVFTGELVWYDDILGLALLEISADGRRAWHGLVTAAEEPILAAPRAVALDGMRVPGFASESVTGNEQSSLTWMLAESAEGHGTLTLASPAGGRRLLEIDRGELPREPLRHGLAGAPALLNDPAPMVLGLVTGQARSRRRRPRLEISLLPDPEQQPAFGAALERIGLPGVVYAMDGPILRHCLGGECLDRSLRPLTVSAIDDPDWFGTRATRSDWTPAGQRHFPFVERPESGALAAALDAATSGAGPQVIVLTGPSAAGKSRLAAEAIRRHPQLAHHRVLTPLRHRPIIDLPQRLRSGPTLLWYDDLHDYSTTALTRPMVLALLEANPSLIVVATMLEPASGESRSGTADSGEMAAHGTDSSGTDSSGTDSSGMDSSGMDSGEAHADQADAREADAGEDLTAGFPMAAASLSGVQSVVDDAAMTAVIPVGAHPDWVVPPADAATAGPAHETRRALRAASRAGVGLGEFLSGYPELADHYTAARWATRALVDVVVDWVASGITVALSRETAFSLWQDYAPTRIPRDELRNFTGRGISGRRQLWDESEQFATETIVEAGSLVTVRSGGLCASEFSRVHTHRTAISTQVWDRLLQIQPTTPDQRLDLGLRALASGTPQRALRAFESILFYRDDDHLDPDRARLIEVTARRGIALYHAHMGRDEQAVWAYTDLIDSFGDDDDPAVAEHVAQALLGVGITFSRIGALGQAVSAYTELLDRYGDGGSPVMAQHVARGLLGQAVTFGQMGRGDDEISAYTEIVDRYQDDSDPALRAICAVARGAIGRLRQDSP